MLNTDLSTNYNNFKMKLQSPQRQAVSFSARKTQPPQADTQTDCFIRQEKITEKDLKIFAKKAAAYPEDTKYKKSLLVSMGENPKFYTRLNSIAGPQELSAFLAENNNNEEAYMPGKRPGGSADVLDSHSLENVQNGKFKSNLHIHSIHSDGHMTPLEILDQAKEYADKQAEIAKRAGRKPIPFIIGTTDHNTLEGSKEMLELIYKSPEKYKNVKVVLGSEISTGVSTLARNSFTKPRSMHVLAMCIDPNNKDSNRFMQEIIEESRNVMQPKTLELRDVVQGFSKDPNCRFGLAHPGYPRIKKVLEKPENYLEVMEEFISYFQKHTKHKGLFVEGFYQGYFGETAKDSKLLKTIKNCCDYLGLFKSGGMDSHGKSIFYNGIKKLR